MEGNGNQLQFRTTVLLLFPTRTTQPKRSLQNPSILRSNRPSNKLSFLLVQRANPYLSREFIMQPPTVGVPHCGSGISSKLQPASKIPRSNERRSNQFSCERIL